MTLLSSLPTNISDDLKKWAKRVAKDEEPEESVTFTFLASPFNWNTELSDDPLQDSGFPSV